MNKKISIIVVIIAICIGVFGWQFKSLSQEDSKYAAKCTPENSEQPDRCCVAYHEAMGAVELAWSQNLDDMMDQEKPASEMVDEAFENLRTYQCWLEYICRAVEYSSYALPETAFGEDHSQLTSAHLGVIPGCQKPEDLGIPDTWDSFVSFLEDDWNVLKGLLTAGGVQEVNVDFPASWFTSNSIPFFPQCMSNPENRNFRPDQEIARAYHTGCMALMDSKFACQAGSDDIKECTSESIAFVKLTNTLKRNHSDQKARALENKLSSIISKLITMDIHVTYLQAKFENLYKLYACFPSKC